MKNSTWLIMIIISFLISSTVGFVALGLCVFNYITAILHSLWVMYKYKAGH
jgi:hypothetical protein